MHIKFGVTVLVAYTLYKLGGAHEDTIYPVMLDLEGLELKLLKCGDIVAGIRIPRGANIQSYQFSFSSPCNLKDNYAYF